MKSPFTGKPMNIVKEWRTMSFRKEEFRVLFHFYKCDDTGEQFEDEDLANLNYNQLVNQYRVKYSILFPEKIKAIREKYHVSGNKMSEILGFGINNYRQYEKGEVPSQSNARLIQLVEDPHELRKLVNINGALDFSFKEKLNRNIDRLIEEQKKERFKRQFEAYLFDSLLPGSFTGYKIPDLDKFSEMVLFFSEKLKPWKTKLNKLLFYADFAMFQQTAFSISGMKYQAIPMGPVPVKFNSIFEFLENNKKIEIFYQNFPDGGTGEQFLPAPGSKFREEAFSERELKILNLVANKFEKATTKEIIETSHQEKGWIENHEKRSVIDYSYGFDLISVCP
jgi:putative zinc finger/helix-turn-helix YgiT family protein